MQVFISWSGDRSRAVAELLDDWIQCVLQAIRPWMSSKDIDRGSLWFSEITDQLQETKIRIVCLTKDNLDKPWILFESGALAKGISSARVCTLLIDLEPTDVANPLAQFNHTIPDKKGIFELVRTLNSSLDEQHSLKDRVLSQVFETYWPKFEKGFKSAIKSNPIDKAIPERTEENILTEVLRTVRTLDRRVRSIERNDSIDEYGTGFKESRKIRSEIFRMTKEGVPFEIMEDLLKGRAPKSLVNKYIREAAHEFETGDAFEYLENNS